MMYCPAPFMSLGIKPNNIITCCCKKPVEWNIEDGLYHNEVLDNFRNDILLNHENLPYKCKTCDIRKNFNHTSEIVRDNIFTFMSEEHNYNIDDIDIMIGNKCNLQCKICDSYNSCIIKDLESHKYPVDKHRISDKTIEDLGRFNVKNITIYGGETMLIPNDVLKILDALDTSLTNVSLFSNGTVVDYNIIDKLKDFKSVKFLYSIDGDGIMNNYLRPPSNMDSIIDNIIKTKNILQDKLRFDIVTTVSVLNIFELEKTIEFLKENIPYKFGICTNILTTPKYLSFSMLDDNIKEKIFETIKDKHMIEYISNSEFDKEYFKDNIEVLRSEIINKDSVFNFNTQDYIHKDMYRYIYED